MKKVALLPEGVYTHTSRGESGLIEKEEPKGGLP